MSRTPTSRMESENPEPLDHYSWISIIGAFIWILNLNTKTIWKRIFLIRRIGEYLVVWISLIIKQLISFHAMYCAGHVRTVFTLMLILYVLLPFRFLWYQILNPHLLAKTYMCMYISEILEINWLLLTRAFFEPWKKSVTLKIRSISTSCWKSIIQTFVLKKKE